MIDPVAVTTYDWVHTLLQNGIFHAEVEAVLKLAGNFGIARTSIQDFLRENWSFPHVVNAKGKQLHRIFDEKRRSAAEPDKLKCSCAEALGVYMLLRLAVDCSSLARPREQPVVGLT